jgi:hypothetical protein
MKPKLICGLVACILACAAAGPGAAQSDKDKPLSIEQVIGLEVKWTMALAEAKKKLEADGNEIAFENFKKAQTKERVAFHDRSVAGQGKVLKVKADGYLEVLSGKAPLDKIILVALADPQDPVAARLKIGQVVRYKGVLHVNAQPSLMGAFIGVAKTTLEIAD